MIPLVLCRGCLGKNSYLPSRYARTHRSLGGGSGRWAVVKGRGSVVRLTLDLFLRRAETGAGGRGDGGLSCVFRVPLSCDFVE